MKKVWEILARWTLYPWFMQTEGSPSMLCVWYDAPFTSLHCLVDGWGQVHLELGLGAKLQQHVDTRSTATAASIEEGCGSVNCHPIDLTMGKERTRQFALSFSPSPSVHSYVTAWGNVPCWSMSETTLCLYRNCFLGTSSLSTVTYKSHHKWGKRGQFFKCIQRYSRAS